MVITLVTVSYVESSHVKIHFTTLYEHPYQIRRTVATLRNDISVMRLSSRDLMLASTPEETQKAIEIMNMADADARIQYDIITRNYLGSPVDVDNAYKAFLNWNEARKVNTQLALQKNGIEEIKRSIREDGKVGLLRAEMLKRLDDIDDFAEKKGIEIYTASHKIIDTQYNLFWITIFCFIILEIIVNLVLLKNIRNPLKVLTNTVRNFKNGDVNVRCEYASKNELGVLSKSFNDLILFVNNDRELNEKMKILNESMLITENSHSFFKELLPILNDLTNSQMSAVYLLDDDNQYYYHYESVGLSEDATKFKFRADTQEGEFGTVLNTKKIHHIAQIPIDTQFIFHTVTGNYIPREIVTIPIVSGKDVLAIISLSSLRRYSEVSNTLIEKTYDVLTARIEGILTYRRLRRFAKRLEEQNYLLDTQKSELSAQSIELLEQNSELEIQKNQLNEVSRLKTNFLSNMSHELRTPLNSVIALSGVLGRKLVNKIPVEEYSYIEVIERNGKNLLTLINDILDIARIEAGREEINIQRFNLNELIVELGSLLNPLAQQKKIKLKIEESPTESFVQSDPDKIRHIIQNLIGNAIKFTEKGAVTVKVNINQDGFEIAVIDTGIGISQEHIDLIFDEFIQEDGSTARKYGGTGLGLSIARKYANLLGGDIEVKSKKNKGSEFKLVIRVQEEKLAKTNYEANELRSKHNVDKSDLNKKYFNKKILLVEDSEPSVIQIRDFLSKSGFEIDNAPNGQKAIDRLKEKLPDAIILDLMMPDVDGFQFLNEIRADERTAEIPVLILTAKQITHDDLAVLKKNHVHQLIQKGDVKRDELLQAVISMVIGSNLPKSKITESIVKPVDGTSKTILIVEDNVDNMLTVKAIIGDTYKTIEAVDGKEAIRKTSEFLPDLILMDLSLPLVSGIEAFKAIRNDRKTSHIPIIALTASAMASDKDIILQIGFDGYLAKPINEKVFFETINVTLNGR